MTFCDRETAMADWTDLTIELASKLIACESVGECDRGAQAVLHDVLRPLGFTVETIRSGAVENLWARFGDASSLLVFAGHTDVVPTGPLDAWSSPPFTPTIRDGYLYGRGAADMKGSIAAFVTAISAFLRASNRKLPFSIGVLIAGDEEADNASGTTAVLKRLSRMKESIDHCIVAEPSSESHLGDTIKVGRRGSLTGKLTVHGKQGHAAYPERTKNPISASLLPLAELTRVKWDEGSERFPPTSLQITAVESTAGASNVVPGVLQATFNLRYSPATDATKIMARCKQIFDACPLEYQLEWIHGAEPFQSKEGLLTTLLSECIRERTGSLPKQSTSGGTSDARYIVKTGAEVVEFGPRNDTIHEVNERVSVDELKILARIFCDLLVRWERSASR